ncbi:MAG: tyrosine-type recombinase/integrase [Chloroflexi bacterium]|nr:tyrosine-type recombinase/integrase [Chloroflexota bacterium]
MKNAVRALGCDRLFESFELSLKADGLRPHTISCYLRDVRRFWEFAQPEDPKSVTSNQIRKFVTSLKSQLSPKTVHEAQMGLRRFFRFLIAESELTTDPSKPVRLTKFRVTPQPTYTLDEVRKLLSSCRVSTKEGVRNHAVISVLFDTGVRESELVSMGIPDWDTSTVWVDGKTGQRLIPLGTNALRSVDRYARKWSVSRGNLWMGKYGPLTRWGVVQLVQRQCAKAGVEHKGVHAFRRAAAAQMKRLGMNDSDILEVMGWKDVTMLRRYTAAVATELAQAAHIRYSPADAL